METTSRFSIRNVYVLILIMLALFAGGIYLGIYPKLAVHAQHEKVESYEGLALLLVFFPGLIALLSVKRMRKMIIGDSSITLKSVFSKQVLTAAEIAYIDLFARESRGWMHPNNVSGIRYTLKSTAQIFVYDADYENIRQLKKALRSNFSGLILEDNLTTKPDPDTKAFLDNHTERFAGNPFFTASNFPIVFFLATLALTFIFGKSTDNAGLGWLIIFLMAFAIFAASGNQMNYFEISATTLTIKNHLWWWRTITYNIDTIAQVIAEPHTRGPIYLHINFKDFSAKTYPASSLRKRTWTELLEKFSKLGITAKSEIYGVPT